MSESTDKLQNEAEIQKDSDTAAESQTLAETTESTDVSASPQSAPPSDDWQIVPVKPRVDSGNQAELISEIREILAKGHRFIAINLKENRFLSLPVIKFCVDAARDLKPKSGNFILLACPEKTKRHFEIYGSLDHIRIVRSSKDLRPLGGISVAQPHRPIERMNEPNL